MLCTLLLLGSYKGNVGYFEEIQLMYKQFWYCNMLVYLKQIWTKAKQGFIWLYHVQIGLSSFYLCSSYLVSVLLLLLLSSRWIIKIRTQLLFLKYEKGHRSHRCLKSRFAIETRPYGSHVRLLDTNKRPFDGLFTYNLIAIKMIKINNSAIWLRPSLHGEYWNSRRSNRWSEVRLYLVKWSHRLIS